jgi:hypothetical protein
MDLLGQTRSSLAVLPLLNIINYSNDKNMVKIAKKNINLLKLSGVNIDNNANSVNFGTLIDSVPYECYSSQIDGSGSLGLIFSRIRNETDIQMFSVIINDFDGIIDCFGFNSITGKDFEKIIERFSQHSTGIKVPPEFIKIMLNDAENLSKSSNIPIPYEYICWKVLLNDISVMKQTLDQKSQAWVSHACLKKYNDIYKSSFFNSWFFDDGDNPDVDKFLKETFEYLIQNKTDIIKNVEKFSIRIEENIQNNLTLIYKDECLKRLFERLLKASYLFNENNQINERNITATLANEIKEGKIGINGLLTDIMKQTVYEFILRKRADLEHKQKAIDNIFRKKNAVMTNIQDDLLIEELDVIIKGIYTIWTG